MIGQTVLRGLELVPVLELEPGRLSARQRPSPTGSGSEMPEAWGRYWSDCLADAGITGLGPLRPASWHVSTRDLTDPAILRVMLDAISREWGGIEALSDPDCEPVLDGGLALLAGGEVLVEPTCCSDLGNFAGWREAAGYRGSKWQMLWIGHPWLSIRYEDGLLILSEPDGSDSPTGKWAARPEELARAVDAAESELERFARRLEATLESLGVEEGRGAVARKLAGLAT